MENRMKFDIFSKDSFRLIVRVMRGDLAMNLASASVEAVATRGQSSVAATIDMSGAASGEIGVIFPAGAMGEGAWDLQVRATWSGETQTVARVRVAVAKASV